MSGLLAAWMSGSVLYAGFLGSLVAGLATGVGALPIFLRREWPRRSEVLMLSAAAGIMLAATAFSLIVPGIEVVVARTGSPVRAALTVGAGILLGASVIWLVHAWAPHEHFIKGREGWLATSLGRNWLFIVAITLHNVPEGMSVGVSYGLEELKTGLAVTLGIGLQNLPEGLAVAAALVSQGFRARRAFLVAFLTGLVEPIGGLVGAAAVGFSQARLPWGLAFAAGAMLFVISGEIIPETHREERGNLATVTLILGFTAMMGLDVLFG